VAAALGKFGARAAPLLRGKVTLDLAPYELGNVIWKQVLLEKRMTVETAEERVADLSKILKSMRVVGIGEEGDMKEVMRLATRANITFYDASYLYAAMRDAMTLVTEDRDLGAVARREGVRTKTASQIAKGQG
jgi:predicted nucleic acid-binding protein